MQVGVVLSIIVGFFIGLVTYAVSLNPYLTGPGYNVQWGGVVIGALFVSAMIFFALAFRYPKGALGIALAVKLFLLAVAYNASQVAFDPNVTDGRPIRGRNGRIKLPGLLGPATTESAEAAYWQEAARHEASSATTFANLANDLDDLGAPPALAERARRSERQERHHARLCIKIAQCFQDTPVAAPDDNWQPPIDLRPPTLTSLAVEALVDGVVGERFAVERLTVGGHRAQPDVASKIQTLAKDEHQHVELAEAVLAWCISVGGWRVKMAVRAAIESLPDRYDYPESLRAMTATERDAAGLVTEEEAQRLWTESCQRARDLIAHRGDQRQTGSAPKTRQS